MPLPFAFSAFWQVYPDYSYCPDSTEVKKDIGGEVDAAWIVNTCAIRMSRGLNLSGVLVPKNFQGLATVKGGDGLRYALRVREMRSWFNYKFGKPDFEVKKKAGVEWDRSVWAGKYGIIAFDIAFADATGHLDAWLSSQYSSEYKNAKNYYTLATKISLWTAL